MSGSGGGIQIYSYSVGVVALTRLETTAEMEPPTLSTTTPAGQAGACGEWEFSVRPCYILYVRRCVRAKDDDMHVCLAYVRAPRCGPSAWTTVSGRRIRAASTTASASRRLPAFGSAHTVRGVFTSRQHRNREIDENCSSRFWDRTRVCTYMQAQAG